MSFLLFVFRLDILSIMLLDLANACCCFCFVLLSLSCASLQTHLKQEVVCGCMQLSRLFVNGLTRRKKEMLTSKVININAD